MWRRRGRTSRFSGLTSLWTMLMPCRYLRAAARLDTMTEASCSVYLAEDVMASNKSPPCGHAHKKGRVTSSHADKLAQLWAVEGTLMSSITR